MLITPTIHLGAPSAVGPLTVFPVWTDAALPRRAVRTGVPRRARVTEVAGGSVVELLTVANPTAAPFVLTGGTIVAGGWQHRVLTGSVLVAADASLDIDVRCVEQGRWGGRSGHAVSRARAPLAVRGALRGVVRPGSRREAMPERSAAQHEVWDRVELYESALGSSPTSSLVEVTAHAEIDVESLVGEVEALPGQRGVLVGVGGHPAVLEVFEHPSGLRRELRSILRGVAVDALLAPAEPTPGRRARAFVARVSRRAVEPAGAAGHGGRIGAADDLADLDGLSMDDDRLLHLSALNVRHTLVAA